MESSLSTLDERVRAILPSLKAWSEMEAEVKRLSARIDVLEAQIASTPTTKTAQKASQASATSGQPPAPSGDRMAK